MQTLTELLKAQLEHNRAFILISGRDDEERKKRKLDPQKVYLTYIDCIKIYCPSHCMNAWNIMSIIHDLYHEWYKDVKNSDMSKKRLKKDDSYYSNHRFVNQYIEWLEEKGFLLNANLQKN